MLYGVISSTIMWNKNLEDSDMCIYDHLFFHAYRIMSHPKNTFNDIPVFASLILVCPCVMFNVKSPIANAKL